MAGMPPSRILDDRKKSCNLCIFCADLRNPDGSIFCMLHRKNNYVHNPCGDFSDSRNRKMKINEVLALAKQKREGSKQVIQKKKGKLNLVMISLFFVWGFTLFVFGAYLGMTSLRMQALFRFIINLF